MRARQGLAAFYQISKDFTGLAGILHWIHVIGAVIYFALFTKVLVDGFHPKRMMKCSEGYVVLVLGIMLIILGYLLRNMVYGEVLYPFL